MDLVSTANHLLRTVARLVPPESRVRRTASAAWTWLLGRVVRHITVRVGGRPIRLLVRHRQLDEGYEAATLATWLRLIRPGDVAWDLGANIGVYTVLSGRAVGPAGTVTAWEPAPYTFGVLQEHIRANELEAICRAEQAAVGSEDGGVVRFRADAAGTATNRISTAPAADGTVEVPVGTLDGWLTRLSRPPHLVKMDIEGAEVLALRGAGRLLGRGGPRPIVLLSVHPMFLTEFGHTPADITAEVDRHGYVSLRLDGTPAPPEQFLEYLLVPAEREEWLRGALAAAPNTTP